MFDLISQVFSFLYNIVNVLHRSSEYLNNKVDTEITMLEKEDEVNVKIKSAELDKELKDRLKAAGIEG